MNNVIIHNWNSCVQEHDEIYFLGDFMFKGGGESANELLQALNGKKYLIKGNHDHFVNDKSFHKNNFVWIKDYYVLQYEKQNIVLFHYPIFEWDGYFKGAIHLYGHVHNTGNDSELKARAHQDGKIAFNVCSDVNDFFPVSIEDIMNKTRS
jgi:calcineurin-like phosphoesterase family protein